MLNVGDVGDIGVGGGGVDGDSGELCASLILPILPLPWQRLHMY